MEAENKAWYVLRTKPRSEKQVHKRLVENGIETYLPLYSTIRQWSDRKKKIQVPLFNSYIFVYISDGQFHIPYVIPGVFKFVTFEGNPAVVPQKDIDNLRILLCADPEFEISERNFKAGQKVKVTFGLLNGLTGELIQSGRSKRLLVRIESIEKNLVVKIPANYLEGIN
jgi:transcription antitermination factor NusG